MVKATEQRGVFVHVARCDRELPESEQTKWHLKPLNIYDRFRTKDLPRLSDDGEISGMGSMQMEMIRAGLVNVEDFEVPFEKRREKVLGKMRDAVTLEFLERVPQDVLDEIFARLQEAGGLTADEKKE